MTPPPHLPESLVRKRMAELVTACQQTGIRPSVLRLAHDLGLSNTTFRRRYPDIARELAGHRTIPAQRDDKPSQHDKLIARNAKLRRRNQELTAQLALATAQIQHLALANARLREALEEATSVTSINRASRR